MHLLGGTRAEHTGHKPNLLTHPLVCFEACRWSKAAGLLCQCAEHRTALVCHQGTNSFTRFKGVRTAICVMAATPPTDTPASCSAKAPVCLCQAPQSGIGHLVCWAQHRPCVPEHGMRLTDSQGLRVCSRVTCRWVRAARQNAPCQRAAAGAAAAVYVPWCVTPHRPDLTPRSGVWTQTVG